MNDWQNFTAEQLEVIFGSMPLVGAGADTAPCPSCRRGKVHWYAYVNPLRPRTAFAYLWCGTCHRFFGQTVARDVADLTDPFDGLGADERGTLEADIDLFFSTLEELWASGQLPQTHR